MVSAEVGHGRERFLVTLVAIACACWLGSATLAHAASAAEVVTTAPNPFVIRWDDHVTPSGSLHVISVVQDHREFPKDLPHSLRPFALAHVTMSPAHAGTVRVFQLAMGVLRDLVDPLRDRDHEHPHLFEKADISWVEIVNGRPKERRLTPLGCHSELPHGTSHRWRSGARYIDLVARCAFSIGSSLLSTLLDQNSSATLVIHGGKDVVQFPLHQVLHFPNLRPIISLKPRPEEGYPTAPWYNAADPHNARLIKRAIGEAAQLRVAAVCTKKYSWNKDDELWLLWMLDVVGVDHLIIAIATRDLDIATVEKAIAEHPGLEERVTLIDLDVPCGIGKARVTYAYLIQSATWDAFVRWQADFDFSFLLDFDEFVQLFDAEDPGMRLDVKTFIAANRIRIQQEGQAHLVRPSIRRSHPNRVSDPNLIQFLSSILQLDGKSTMATFPNLQASTAAFGKTLFMHNATLRPYLHFNLGWSRKRKWQVRYAHILHIREGPTGISLEACLKRMASEPEGRGKRLAREQQNPKYK